MPLLLDAAGTLIHPAEPVGAVYARQLEAASGLSVDPDVMQSAFLSAFSAAPLPDYSLHPFGHAAEHAWWRDLVSSTLQSLGGREAEFSSDPAGFDSYFRSLFEHYSLASSWALFPEVPDFLDAAAGLGPLAVVSNFDDRLAPILDGLGIGPCFEHVFTSADARARKPDQAIFDLAIDRLNCAPHETIHCGDSLEADFNGAARAGLDAYHLQRPGQTLMDFLHSLS